jgi:cysteine synthase
MVGEVKGYKVVIVIPASVRAERSYFLRAGVIAAVPQIDFSVPGFQAVVSADHLDTDLSGWPSNELR